MADVFISYSKTRAAEAQKLAAELADLGYDVWWDTRLLPTGAFASEIDRQLDMARAVIVIWSHESVRSKWVRSEAAHSDRQDKLVNTHLSGLDPVRQIPKPFDQTHSVEVGNIRAIVAALDALRVPRSGGRPAPVFGTQPASVADGDDRLFAQVERAGSAPAYDYYLGELPEGRHAPVARDRLKALKQPAASGHGSAAGRARVSPRWIRAIALTTIGLVGGMLIYRLTTALWTAGGLEAGRPTTIEKAKREDSKQSSDVPEKRKVDEDMQAKRTAEHQRLALLKIEEKAKRKANEKAARPDPALSVKPGSGLSFRDRLADGQPCQDCPEMVVLPAGAFMMGSAPAEIAALSRLLGYTPTKESPQRKLTIARPFAVGRFEVTFAEWDACVAVGGCSHRPGDEGWGRGRRPVVNVSWDGAKEFVAWLSRKTGKSYRLLSEAEWEYAARAGTTTRYSFGPAITSSQANKGGLQAKTVEVGSYPANGFGLFDMHGNVDEWCEDHPHPNYQGAPDDGSVWEGGDTTYRLLRGGSWAHDEVNLRSAYRSWNDPFKRGKWTGFRVGRSL